MTLEELAKKHGLKICTGCGEALTLDMYDKHSTVQKKSGPHVYYHAKCKLCRAETKLEREEKRAARIAAAVQKPVIHVGPSGIDKQFFCRLPPTECERRSRYEVV